ncbi:signal recognition particle-docking protein FtsY [Rhizobiales bacterium RZME27]|uniref:Signal recognition particle receptor FtsY n=1 Tax=Endobacterium cereale TaxID=2663029 RepID=A0A6A8A9I2_9HYPH|nr:signal recognition particle-docking protein FtsY [Endobacterium cereale]MEB2847595.1 signal recognition particle-docking protein FtsY [Endobacterium cereale]MQY47945.1 signal recognition particle-docking protein FtsY [Endobacterium cereale]
MALSFIKRVFTFGDKPVEDQATHPAPDTAADVAAVQAELEPKSRDENLPVAADPVAQVEIETAGGPSGDVVEVVGETAAEPTEDEPAAILPGVDTSDLGVVPLSLLEAEAEAVAGDDLPPSALPGISPSGGQITDAAVSAPSDQSVTGAEVADDNAPVEGVKQAETETSAKDRGAVHALATPAVEQEASPLVISPLEGEMSGRTEGGVSAPAEANDEPPAAANAPSQSEGPTADAPVLPKGFSTAKPEAEPVAVVAPAKLTWFQRLRAGLARTSSQLTGQISALFTKRKLDEQTLEELEDLLIQADLGVETAMRITDTLSSERYGKDVTGEDVSRIMSAEITKVLTPVAKPLQLDLDHKPHVILVVGVNGTGKTTTIGKLAAKLSGSGLKVMLAAGDTFRAAAIEQLKIWADRTGSQFIGTKLGADAAGLAYDAFEQARANKSDVLIIDTAGRLQNRTELMAELEKIVRVLNKLDPDAPHTVLQTLDATTGQNAMNQVEIFRNVAGVSGLIMTKLDGTARGGILVAIAAKHKLPVYFIGVGEGVDDLEPFEAQDFAHAIAGLTH